MTSILPGDAALMVHVHLHQWHLWPELRACLASVCVPHALYFTLPYNVNAEERDAHRAELLQTYPHAVVLVHENRGMDPGGFLLALHHAQTHERAHRYVLKLHTKTRDDWRRALLHAMLRDADTFRRALEQLQAPDSRVGMLGAARWIIGTTGMDLDSARVGALLASAQMRYSGAWHFVGGTMFLARLEPLLRWSTRVNLRALVHDMPLGRPSTVGVPHSLERLFGLLVHMAGLQVVALDVSSAADDAAFDWCYYVAQYEDLRRVGISTEEKARAHWQAHGRWERRRPCPSPDTVPLQALAKADAAFDWRYYVAQYEDLRRAGINTEEKARAHWQAHGRWERRRPSAASVDAATASK